MKEPETPHLFLEKEFFRIHFVGIGGIGMAGLAQILRSRAKAPRARPSRRGGIRGYHISGSDDLEGIFMTDEILKKNKIHFSNFSANNIHKGIDLVIASTAYLPAVSLWQAGLLQGAKNPEIEKARKLRIPVISYPEALAGLFNQSRGIAVAGSHGKTTTTALCGLIFQEAELKPTVLVGGEVKQWNSNVLCPKLYTLDLNHFFIIEADEYRNAFLDYQPETAIVTNVDFDHPDFFSKVSYCQAFERFIGNIKPGGKLICWGDDENIQKVLKKTEKKSLSVTTYGFKKENAFRIRDLGINKKLQTFRIDSAKVSFQFSIPVFGKGYILDTAAAAILALKYKIPLKKIKKALISFAGITRRFDFILKEKGLPIIFDDYAHHPTEISNTLSVLKKIYQHKKLVLVFQPHTFTRTITFLKKFINALRRHDGIILLLEIYGSAREKEGRISSKDIVKALSEDGKNVLYFKTAIEAEDYLKQHLTRNHLVACLGAGDGPFKLAHSLALYFKKKKHYTVRNNSENVPREV